MLKILFVILCASAIIGCGSAQQLSANRHLISAPYGGDVSYPSALAKLETEAARSCKDGFRKLHDFDTIKNGQRILVWEFMCKGYNPNIVSSAKHQSF